MRSKTVEPASSHRYLPGREFGERPSPASTSARNSARPSGAPASRSADDPSASPRSGACPASSIRLSSLWSASAAQQEHPGRQSDPRCLAQVLDRERDQRLLGLDAEDGEEEGPLAREPRLDRLCAPEAVALAGERDVGDRQALLPQ